MDSLKYNKELEHYFNLKKIYNNNYDRIKNNIIKKNSDINKCKKLIKNIKTPCVGCKRKVNTIFEIENRICIARCGDEKNPCKLDIQIKKATTVNLLEQLTQFRKILEQNQRDIVKLKYSMLYELLDNNDDDNYIQKFEKINNEYKKNNEAYNGILEHLTEYIEKNKKIEKNNEKLDIDLNIYISNFNECIKHFKLTNHVNFINDAIGIYIHNIKPILDNIRKNKSINNFIEIYKDKTIEDKITIYYKTIPFNKDINEYIIEEQTVIKNQIK